MNVISCNSFQEWMNEIQKRNKDAYLVPMDNPFQLKLGFYDSKNDEQVLVSLASLKKYIMNLDKEEQKETLRKSFASDEGKEKFLNFKAS